EADGEPAGARRRRVLVAGGTVLDQEGGSAGGLDAVGFAAGLEAAGAQGRGQERSLGREVDERTGSGLFGGGRRARHGISGDGSSRDGLALGELRSEGGRRGSCFGHGGANPTALLRPALRVPCAALDAPSSRGQAFGAPGSWGPRGARSPAPGAVARLDPRRGGS